MLLLSFSCPKVGNKSQIITFFFFFFFLLSLHTGLDAFPFLAEDRCDDDHPCRGACGYRGLLSADPVRRHLGGMEEQALRRGGGHRPQRNHHGRRERYWIICGWIHHDR